MVEQREINVDTLVQKTTCIKWPKGRNNSSCNVVKPNVKEDRDIDASVMAEIREKGGDEGILDGVHMLILHTVGAKSGQPRQNPLVYQPAINNGGEIYIFASNAGQDRNSAWYYNILAHPEEVSIEIGSVRYPVTVRVVTGEERDRIYGNQADRIENFADYQRKTARLIPVVGLTRTE